MSLLKGLEPDSSRKLNTDVCQQESFNNLISKIFYGFSLVSTCGIYIFAFFIIIFIKSQTLVYMTSHPEKGKIGQTSGPFSRSEWVTAVCNQLAKSMWTV